VCSSDLSGPSAETVACGMKSTGGGFLALRLLENPPSARLLVAASDTNETSAQLVAAWCERGFDAELVPPPRLRGSLYGGETVLARLDVLPTVDGVEPGLLDLLMLERAGVRVLNSAASLLKAHDKLRTAQSLAHAHLPQPWTMHLPPGSAAPRLVGPVVLKPRFGSWGTDVFRCETENELRRCLEEVRERHWFRRQGALLQELITPRGYDLRVVVAGGTVVGAIERVARQGEWRTNISLGGSKRPCVPTQAASTLAETAAAAIGADLVGVDLLPVDGKYVVIELNAAVEFDGDYSLPGVDVYAESARSLGIASTPAERLSGREWAG